MGQSRCRRAHELVRSALGSARALPSHCAAGGGRHMQFWLVTDARKFCSHPANRTALSVGVPSPRRTARTCHTRKFQPAFAWALIFSARFKFQTNTPLSAAFQNNSEHVTGEDPKLEYRILQDVVILTDLSDKLQPASLSLWSTL